MTTYYRFYQTVHRHSHTRGKDTLSVHFACVQKT